MMLGCMLTPPVNGSYTGTITVSSAFTPSATVFTRIRKLTTKRTWTARATAPRLDVLSSNGVGHRTGLPLMPKEVAFSL